MSSIKEIWENTLKGIKGTIANASYQTWFQDTSMIHLDNETAVIKADTQFQRDWLEKNYSGLIQEQLFDILKKHQVRLIDLFREWDDDANGALDKKELRQAIAALGYVTTRQEMDIFFDAIDVGKNGWIEFDELKAALTEKAAKQATLDLQANST